MLVASAATAGGSLEAGALVMKGALAGVVVVSAVVGCVVAPGVWGTTTAEARMATMRHEASTAEVMAVPLARGKVVAVRVSRSGRL